MSITDESGNWHKLKGALKKKFASLTENDQLFLEGEQQVMYGKQKILLGKTKEDLDRIIATLSDVGIL